MKEYLVRTELTNKENAIRLVVKKAADGCDFGDADIYVKSSDKSGDFYVKYCLCYEKNAVGSTCETPSGEIVPLTWYNGSNGGFNRSNYRIKTAAICKRNGDSFEKLYDVLQQGEISMAFKEKFADNSAMAGDFVGGFHGDENIKYNDGKPMVAMWLDGTPISLDGREERAYEGGQLKFEQTTLINRCNTPDVNIIEHSQSYTFDAKGMHNTQKAKFITSEYEEGGKYALDNGGSYLQMCTFWRLNKGEKYVRICDDLKFYDESGKLVGEANTLSYDSGDFGWAGTETEKINRTVEYNGETGVYGLVGFKIVEDSAECHSAKIMIRTHGDNKWYCTFKSKNPTAQPVCGEEWVLDLLYYVDYNSER